MESDIEYEWNREQVMALIELFRNQPVLWDRTNSEFKDKNIKHQAWKDIASDLQVSKAAAQSKMRNLITQFHRELRKTKSGSGAEEAQIKWTFYGHLLFLKDKTTRRSHTREFGVKEDAQSPVDESAGNNGFSTLVHVVEISDIGEETYASNSTTHSNSTPPTQSSRKRRHNQVEEPCSSLKSLQEFGRKDEFDVFGENVAWQIRKLTDKRDQALAKYRINKLLFEMEMTQVTSHIKNEQPDATESP